MPIVRVDPETPLKKGERAPMTLVFETAGKASDIDGGHTGRETNRETGG